LFAKRFFLKVQRKILLVLLAVLTVFIVFGFVIIKLRKQQDKIILEEKRKQQWVNIESVLKFRTKNLVEVVSDYAVGDELVNFVNKKNIEWAQNNLLFVLKFHPIDAIWVYNNNGELVYHVNKIAGYKNKIIPIQPVILTKILASRTFICHIFQNPHYIQVCGSTIHNTKDINRLEKPNGYLLMAKVWDVNYFDDLKKLTNTQIVLKKKNEDQLEKNSNDFIYNLSVNDAFGKELLNVVFIRENTFLDILNNMSNNFLIYLMIQAFIIITLFILAFHRFVNIPLRIITQSLNREDAGLLKSWNPSNEFGRIGTLIKHFYEQKEKLALEMKENIKKTIALQESESNFRSFIEQSSDGIMIFEDNGSLIEVNSSLAKILNTEIPDLKQQKVWDLFIKYFTASCNNEDIIRIRKEKLIEALQARDIDRLTFSGNETVQWADKSLHFISMVVFPVFAGQRFLVGSILSDITQFKKAEMEISNALIKEKELHELKTHFISTVSHEFRTPMTIIFSNLQLIESLKDSPAEIEKCFNRIYTAIKQMTHILDQVNLMNKDFAGKLGFIPVAVDFEELCKRSISDAASINKAVEVILDIRARFGKICIDPTLVQYIILNLLSNAIKYSKLDSPVKLIIGRKEDNIELIFEDKGIGIPEQDIPRIFEPFHRGKNTDNIKGTGLGLPIVKRSIELHGGSIDVKSRAGTGTIITVLIPLVMEETEENSK
jgi:PAS domain S-box-containing protein